MDNSSWEQYLAQNNTLVYDDWLYPQGKQDPYALRNTQLNFLNEAQAGGSLAKAIDEMRAGGVNVEPLSEGLAKPYPFEGRKNYITNTNYGNGLKGEDAYNYWKNNYYYAPTQSSPKETLGGDSFAAPEMVPNSPYELSLQYHSPIKNMGSRGGGILGNIGNLLSGGVSNALGVTNADNSFITSLLSGSNIQNATRGFIQNEDDAPWPERMSRWIDSSIDFPTLEGSRASEPGFVAGQGLIDNAFRATGEILPQGVRDIAPAAGTVIGGIIGSYVPVIGTTAGAAGGNIIGQKLAGKPYTSGAITAGTAAASLAASGLMAANSVPTGMGPASSYQSLGGQVADPYKGWSLTGEGINPDLQTYSNLAGEGYAMAPGVLPATVDPTLASIPSVAPLDSYIAGGALPPTFEESVIQEGIFDPATGGYKQAPNFEDVAYQNMLKSGEGGVFYGTPDYPIIGEGGGNWYDNWQEYLRMANKVLGPYLAQEGTDIPGRPGAGGSRSTLDFGDIEGLMRSKKNSNASNLGIGLLEGSEFPLTYNPNIRLEDYIQ